MSVFIVLFMKFKLFYNKKGVKLIKGIMDFQ